MSYVKNVFLMLSSFFFICSIPIMTSSLKAADQAPVKPGHYVINSFGEPLVRAVIESCGPNTLLTCDVDHTLLMHQGRCARIIDACVSGSGSKRMKPRNQERPFDSLHSLGYSVVWLDKKRVLVEGETTIGAFNAFKNRGVRFLGLSHTETGRMGHIKDLPNYRSKQLEELDLTFDVKIPDDLVASINETLQAHFSRLDPTARTFPYLHASILCTNKQVGSDSKGSCLEASIRALPSVDWPTLIVSIDDCPEDLASIQAACERLGIPVITIEYRGSKYHAVPPRSDFCDMGRSVFRLVAISVGRLLGLA